LLVQLKISVVKNRGQIFKNPVNMRDLVVLHRITIFAKIEVRNTL